MFGFKRRRRERLKETPLSAAAGAIVARNMPYFRYLSADEQRKLLGFIQVFLSEKSFEGCGGLKLTDEIRLTVAAHACLLLLHREEDFYPNLCSVLVYPASFSVRTVQHPVGPFTEEQSEIRVGEAWQRGVVILAWDGVLRGAQGEHDGFNVVLHEFAHQLDMENGAADGYPGFRDRALAERWPGIMSEAYERALKGLEEGRGPLVGRYGVRSPSEFFATLTECFFERPHSFKAWESAVYELFTAFYQQDPSKRIPPEREFAAERLGNGA